MAQRRLRVLISGRVQGVGFRYFALAVGQELGLAGWVRNLADGRVEVMAEGEEGSLQRLMTRLRRGPVGARVDNLQVSWAQGRGDLSSFRVEATSY